MERDKYILLFPLTLNDGSVVPQAVLNEFKDELFVIAGGYTITGTVEGAYRIKSGKKQLDKLLQIWVCPEKESVAELLRVVAVYAERLGQESMYFERTGGTVELLTPLRAGGAK